MSLFGAMAVSASGMSAQRRRAELLVENLANAETTRTPEGGPYRRKDAVFATQPEAASFASQLDAELQQGVTVDDIVVDSREPERRYQPGHPDADAKGYVAYPAINPVEEMTDLLGAVRAYELNAAAVQAAKNMIQQSLDLLR